MDYLQEATKDGYYFDEDEANRAEHFFTRYLSILDKPFKPLDWQRKVIRDLHGWKAPSGKFRFKRAFVSTAKKSGKTELNSGLSLLHLTAGYNPRPNVVCVANDKGQAAQVFDNISHYVRHSQKLRDALHLVPSWKKIEYPKKEGTFRVLSSDVKGKYGHGYSFISFDEICLAPNDKLFNALQYSSISIQQPIHVAISTAGYDRTDNNPGWRLYQYAKDIISGTTIDPEFYAAIWETPEDADLDDPKVWKMANPGLGVTQEVSTFKSDWERAKKNKAEYLEFLRFRFNRWTSTRDQWIDLAAWDQCKGGFPADPGPVYLGLDLSSTFDLCSMGLVTTPDSNGKHYCKNWNWTTQIACDTRAKQNLQRYEVFKAHDELTIFPGNAIEYDKIRTFILQLRNKYKIAGIVIEKWNWLQFAQQLEKDGFTIYPFSPSAAQYNAPTKQFEQLIRERNIVHDGNELLRWAVQNASIEVDSNSNQKPKRTTENNKIDPVVSVILALSAAMQHDKLYKVKDSVYSKRGVLYV
jgi:phage terminase large subunit-like protein